MFWLLSASFFLVLLILILINAKVNGGFKIETSWLGISLCPVILWLLATGQLAEFTGFGLAFKLNQVSAKPVSLNLEGDRIEPAPVPLEEKEGLARLPELVKHRIAALALQVNRRGYYSNAAIRQYLEELTRYTFFHHVVFTETDGKFRGIMPARDLLDQMRQKDLDLVKLIEEGALDRLVGVQTMPITTNSSKRDALKKMDDQQLSEVPVVNEAGRFVGMVERDKLTSNILLQLVTQR